CGLHLTESRRGRNSLHAPRGTLRTTLGGHHEQFDLRAVGPDLSGSDGDGRGDRSPGAPLRAAGIRCLQFPDRAREAEGKTYAKPTGGGVVTETTAQDASGATIAAGDDLQVDGFFAARAMARPRGG